MVPKVYFSPPMRTQPTDAGPESSSTSISAPVPTPPSVRDVSPSICLELVEFKGTSAPPSLLQQHDKRFSSAAAADLGKSTYASLNDTVCASFWRELLDVWVRREDTIRYCIAVNGQAANPAAGATNPDSRLDKDYVAAPAPAPAWSRAENRAEFTERQLRNELAVESIIRRRSLEVFKSRCRTFVPTPSDTVEGAREQAFWEGK